MTLQLFMSVERTTTEIAKVQILLGLRVGVLPVKVVFYTTRFGTLVSLKQSFLSEVLETSCTLVGIAQYCPMQLQNLVTSSSFLLILHKYHNEIPKLVVIQ